MGDQVCCHVGVALSVLLDIKRSEWAGKLMMMVHGMEAGAQRVPSFVVWREQGRLSWLGFLSASVGPVGTREGGEWFVFVVVVHLSISGISFVHTRPVCLQSVGA